MKIWKRCICLLLAMTILVGVMSPAVYAASAEESASVNTDNVTIEGSNGFGNLLSQEITESQEESAEAEAEYPGGYTVTDLEIEGNTATVTYDTLEEAILVVALYTEDGMQMVTSATAAVSPDETEAELTFGGEMPEYFLASAYLMDTYDLSPLCAAYDTPMYTQEMQELLASSVEDYDADRVLNLDDDNTTNFAVYAETTKIIEAVEGVNLVAAIDDENATYVIKNADEQITSLVAGDVFVYPYAENEILIVKVATTAVDGTTVTITGDELEMEEAFAAVKIEGTDSTENMVVDDSTADDGVTYEGISEPSNSGAISPMNDEFGVEFSKSAKFKIDKDVVSKADGDIKINVAGSVEFSVKAELSYYVSATRQFVDFRIEKSVTGAFTITGKLKHEWKLCDAALYPVPGIGIGIEPTFKIEVSGEIEFNITLSGMIGFTYDAKQGMKPLFSTPHFDPDVKAECTIFIGFDLKPKVKVAEGYLAEFTIEVPIGLEFKITRTGNGGTEPSETDLSYHTCARCLDLEVFFKVEVTVKLQFLKCKWLKIEGTLISEKDGLGHAYFSFDHVELGFGLCPYLTHRLTVIVTDGDGNPIPEADVTVAGNTVKTTDKGSAVFYLNAGNYPLEASSGDLTRSQRVQINQAQKVTVKLVENPESDIGVPGILGTVAIEIITDTITVAETTYNNHTYRIIDTHMTWSEAKKYCESLGGYLLTVTSAEENAVIVNLLSQYATKNCYWIGLFRESVGAAWQWVTGETFAYTNWAANEPNNNDGEGELTVHLFGKKYTGGMGIKYIGNWNDAANDGAGYASTFYDLNHFGLICEFDGTDNSAGYESADPEVLNAFDDEIMFETEEIIPDATESVGVNNAQNSDELNAVYPGDYGTEITDTYTLKTASFTGLVPSEQYVLFAMKSIEVDDPLSADNLLFIDQAEALEDGTLSFQYVQRETVDISYVVACGASNKNLNDAEITFPGMAADGELQAVNPIVVYDGTTLTEGQDYVIVGTVDFTEAGEYTCYIRGIHNYTGLVECTYSVNEKILVTAIDLDQSNLEMALGEMVQLTASVLPENATNKALDWSSSDEAIAEVDENGMVTAIAEGTAEITAAAADGSGISTSCTVKVIIPAVPGEPDDEEALKITNQPADYVGRVGDVATFTVIAEGEGLKYQWYFSTDDGATWQKSSGTTNTLTVEFKAYRLNYLYRCEITDSVGNTVVSNAATLLAEEIELAIVTQPISYVGAVNDNVTFTVEATGNGLVYEWFYSNDGGATWLKSYSPGYQTDTLAPILRAHRDGNMYKCVITDVFGNTVTTDAVSMTVKASDVVIITQPQDVENAILGQLYQFSVKATGDNLTYRWEFSADGGETWQESWNQGYNTETLSVRMNANRDGYQYRCVVTSGLKTVVISDAATLDLQDSSAEITSQSGNVYVVANETATFTVEAEGTDLTYLWYRSNDKGATWTQTYLSGYNTNTLSFTANAGRAAMYMCKVTDGSGKVVWSEPVKLQILSAELKILTQPASVTCAAGETAVFTVAAQGDTLKYQWYASADGGETWTMSYLTGYNTAEFSFVVNASRAARLYKCVITDVAGNTVETDVVSVTIG